MSIAPVRPPVAWAQNVSAAFNSSGNLSVATKFRQVDSYWLHPLLQSAQLSTFAVGYTIITSKNAGVITAQLCNGSTQLSTNIPVYIWATGVM